MPNLTNSRELQVFGPLEPLEKNIRSRSRLAFGKNQEPEPPGKKVRRRSR